MVALQGEQVALLHLGESAEQRGGRGQDRVVEAVEVLGCEVLAEELLHEAGKPHAPGKEAAKVFRNQGQWAAQLVAQPGRGLAQQADLIQLSEQLSGRARELAVQLGEPLGHGDRVRRQTGLGPARIVAELLPEVSLGAPVGEEENNVRGVVQALPLEENEQGVEKVLPPGDDANLAHAGRFPAGPRSPVRALSAPDA